MAVAQEHAGIRQRTEGAGGDVVHEASVQADLRFRTWLGRLLRDVADRVSNRAAEAGGPSSAGADMELSRAA